MVVAVMTNDDALAAVIRERNVAVGTLNRLAARAAENKTRITATVEQDDRLLPTLARLADRFQQLIGEHARFSVPHKHRPHIDDLRGRHRPRIDALGQGDEVILALASVVKRFERGRGGTENDGGGFLLRADDGNVTSVVIRRFLLPVRGFVFLVDDDQSEVPDRREHSRSGSNHDASLTVFDTRPFVKSLALLK